MWMRTALALVAVAITSCAILPEDRASQAGSRTQAGLGLRPHDGSALFPVHAHLFLCPGAPTRNVGALSRDREVTVFTPWIDTPAGPLLRNPTETSCLSSGFGFRPWGRGGERGRHHFGVDLAHRTGGYIMAAGDGVITRLERAEGGYGLHAVIDHGRGVETRYAHFVAVDADLREGFSVKQGQILGLMGMTGNATGVHLHYEVRLRNAPLDPLTYGPMR